jgi:hypothetical protein
VARYELTLSGGEKFLVDHPAAAMVDLLANLEGKEFLLFTEIRDATSAPSYEVIVATRQIVVVRSVESASRQNTTFRPKR